MDLLKLAIEGHGGLRRSERITRFRVAASSSRDAHILHTGGLS